jgi:hypothetical protein
MRHTPISKTVSNETIIDRSSVKVVRSGNDTQWSEIIN